MKERNWVKSEGPTEGPIQPLWSGKFWSEEEKFNLIPEYGKVTVVCWGINILSYYG